MGEFLLLDTPDACASQGKGGFDPVPGDEEIHAAGVKSN